MSDFRAESGTETAHKPRCDQPCGISLRGRFNPEAVEFPMSTHVDSKFPWCNVLIVAALSSAFHASGAEPVGAANYPVRPIRLLLGLPAGGSADIVARTVSSKLGEVVGQPIVVDNRPGASGLIAPRLAAKAQPDGYTLLLRASFFSELVASVSAPMPYDFVRDFAPVSLVVKVPNLLVVNPRRPLRTVSDLIAFAKANPGKLNYASPGRGSSAHLAMELLKRQTGTDLVHIPYKGAPQAINALLADEVQMMFGNAPAQLPHVRNGTLRALAVTSAARNRQLPNVPTMIEQGLKDFEFTVWFGVVAPVGVHHRILSKLNEALVKTLALKEVREALIQLGGEPAPTSPEEFAAFQQGEIRKWAKVAAEAGASRH